MSAPSSASSAPDAIAEAAADIVRHVPPDEAVAGRAFVPLFFRHLSARDMADCAPAALRAAALSIWTLARRRKSGDALIRVHTPQSDTPQLGAARAVVEIVNDDMPFLVDSVTATLNGHGFPVRRVIHPILQVTRGANGAIAGVADPDAGDGARESFMRLELDADVPPERAASVETDLRRTLSDVRAAVADWAPMRARADAVAADLRDAPPPGADPKAVAETAAFLQWLRDKHFVFLGYRALRYTGAAPDTRVAVVADSGLGVLRRPDVHLFAGMSNLARVPKAVREAFLAPDLMRLVKSSRRSRVHRAAHMDVVSIKTYGPDGALTGEHMFAGLLGSFAYNRSVMDIPVVREKVRRILRASGFRDGSHGGRALLNALETHPRDELFLASAAQLAATASDIVELQRRRQVAVFLRPDLFQRHVVALAFVPRDAFTTKLRRRIGAALAAMTRGEVTGHVTRMSDDPLCRVQFTLAVTPGRMPALDPAAVTAEIAAICHGWEDQLRQALVEKHGPEAAAALGQRYGRAFPIAYQDATGPNMAVADIGLMETLRETGQIGLNLRGAADADASRARLRVCNPRGHMTLSRIIPMLEDMGLRVLAEQPFRVAPHDPGADGADGAAATPSISIHDFLLETADGRAVDIAGARARFHDCFRRVWTGVVDSDGFNRLVLAAGLDWRGAALMRAIAGYLRQTGTPYSPAHIARTLVGNPALAAALAALFHARFAPAKTPEEEDARDAAQTELAQKILDGLAAVTRLDEDRILRRVLGVIRAMTRANFFQTGADGAPRPWIAFKIAPRQMTDMPQPVPFREIYVHSPQFEAVHLRFGAVARGGLRWSDRPEDFRTEVLGLVKAQQVKNAVIVPEGAKGGFVLRRPPEDAGARRDAGVACYKQFIEALLDLTDTLTADGVQPPARVTRHDGDDPYLVVAADKGTASFSDHANAIARARGFWLGDAFASGGSAGYDHKKMGITARGGWESVKRHFREMGHDTQSQDFTVAGVGDMGGDVFGNGMLLSRHIRLVAAFNHLHIFLDPAPDAARSFAERARLFEGGLGWDRYDPALISAGGGVFSRSAKAIPLPPEARALLDTAEESLPPDALIRLILAARVDLLWFGGIGTYVRGDAESNADVGDRANDALRIRAGALRCRVVGEGANLGLTHRARIDYARGGGRINSDAIDNAAGVDCSDHEVNIKILLGGTGLDQAARDSLLEEMTDDVASLVLRDNYQQTQCLSVLEACAAEELDQARRLMRALERDGQLDRALEFLPDDAAIAGLARAGRGLTRPELAVILAYAKTITRRALLKSDLPDDPALEAELARYFPRALSERFPEAMRSHRLRREIIATAVANAMHNRTGPAFAMDMAHRTGHAPADVARAFIITRRVLNLRDLWRRTEALDGQTAAESQIGLLRETRPVIARMTEWFLNAAGPGGDLDITRTVEAYRPGVARLRDSMDEILEPLGRDSLRERTAQLAAPGVPPDLAAAVAQLRLLASACDVVRLADGAGCDALDAGRAYTAVGSRFRLDHLRAAAAGLGGGDSWQRRARDAVTDDLWRMQATLTARVLAGGAAADGALQAWIAPRRVAVARLDALLEESMAHPAPNLAAVTLAAREVARLVDAG